MTRRRGILLAALGLVVMLVVAGLIGYPRIKAARQCSAATATRDQEMKTPAGSGGGRLVVALTDSYGQGVGLAGPGAAWPSLVARQSAATVRQDSFGGTGFVARGMCPSTPSVQFAARLADDRLLQLHPDVLVVQGGVNDAREEKPPADVAAQASATLREAAAVRQVIVIGPAAAPSVDQGAITAVDAALRQAASAAGRTYVPLLGQPITFNADRLHPDAAGQALIARLVGAAVS